LHQQVLVIPYTLTLAIQRFKNTSVLGFLLGSDLHNVLCVFFFEKLSIINQLLGVLLSVVGQLLGVLLSFICQLLGVLLSFIGQLLSVLLSFLGQLLSLLRQ